MIGCRFGDKFWTIFRIMCLVLSKSERLLVFRMAVYCPRNGTEFMNKFVGSGKSYLNDFV